MELPIEVGDVAHGSIVMNISKLDADRSKSASDSCDCRTPATCEAIQYGLPALSCRGVDPLP